MTELSTVAACRAVYTVDDVKYTVPALLLTIFGGTAWQRFSAERDASSAFETVKSIGLSLMNP